MLGIFYHTLSNQNLCNEFCNLANYYTQSMADTYPVSGGVNEPDGVLLTVQLYGHRPVPSWKIKNPIPFQVIFHKINTNHIQIVLYNS